MKNRKLIFTGILILSNVLNIWGVNFSNLNISTDDNLLFKVDFETQNALFNSKIPELKLQQLTAYPERLEIVGNNVLVFNRFGAVKIPSSGGLPSVLEGFPSLQAGNVPLKGRSRDFILSSDGRWIIYIDPTGPAYGDLFLLELSSGNNIKISEKVELPSLNEFPAVISPDSRLVIYSKGGSLFFYPNNREISSITDDRYRQLGSGTINSIVWGRNGELFYLNENKLLQIIQSELITRAIYGDFLSIGNVVASFSIDFNPVFDRYWVSPDTDFVLIEKNAKNLFLFELGANQYRNSILPHVTIPDNEKYSQQELQSINKKSINVFWTTPGLLTIVSLSQKESMVWRFEIKKNLSNNTVDIKTPSVSLTDFFTISNNGSPYNGCEMSPDNTKILFWNNRGIDIRDYAGWQLLQRLNGENILTCNWLDNRELISGNSNYIEAINITQAGNPRRKICLSNADQYGFEQTPPSRIVAKAGNDWYVCGENGRWASLDNPKLKINSLISNNYRVYLESRSSGPFKNMPMIRNIRSIEIFPLINKYTVSKANTDDLKIKVALCFDLYDDDTGLPQVLKMLYKHDKKATFFLNGDFIRKYPNAATAIAEAGHEAASLFYAPIDLSDARYRVNSEFIINGLARNEDEYYRASGGMLSFLWHPPFYQNTQTINDAALKYGYTTVSRTIDAGDWLSTKDALKLNLHQNSVPEMIETIIGHAKNNAIVPIRIGLLPGGRDDYLFRHIDVLFDALTRAGCDIVTVSTAMRK